MRPATNEGTKKMAKKVAKAKLVLTAEQKKSLCALECGAKERVLRRSGTGVCAGAGSVPPHTPYAAMRSI